MSTVRKSWPGLAILAALLAGLVGSSFLGNGALAQKPVPEDPVVMEHARSLSKAFRRAAEVATPTVVKISTKTTAKTVKSNNPMQGENPFKGTPFEQYFNQMPGEGRMLCRDGVGSGVIIDKSGIVLTNNHVVEGADEVIVHLNDGRDIKATDIKTDPQSDLAVLRIKSSEPLPSAKLGDSDKMEIGDWVIAVGSPFELESTVSAGIISAKGRELSSNKRTKFLQTDAAINPGNSGGPLLNLEGEVVGINTAIASENGSFNGIGFAIPSNTANWVMKQLVSQGSVQRAYLGVAIEEVNGELAEKFGVARGDGVLVSEVFPNSPAAEAGFQEGDLIKSFGGQRVRSPRELQENVEKTAIGSQQAVEVLRDGKAKTLSVTAKALPEKFGSVERGPRRQKEEPSVKTFKAEQLGLSVTELNSSDAEQLGLKDQTGVLISQVEPDGVAADKGLREGMLIRKVGKTVVKDLKGFEEALKNESLKEGILLQVRTQNGNRFVVLQQG